MDGLSMINPMPSEGDDQWVVISVYDDEDKELLSSLEALAAEENYDSQKGETTCYFCGKQFSKIAAYHGHLKKHILENIWTCPSCPDVRFSSKNQLINHLSKTHNIKLRLFRCTQCGYSFPLLSRLRAHMISKHSDKSTRPYACQTCGSRFHKPSDLKKHELIHLDVTLKCNVCDKGFKDKSNLKRHMMSHTGENPYVCSGCNRRFRQIRTMKRHKNVCRGKMLDDSTFDSKTAINTTVGTRKRHCTYCGLQFEYINELKHHIQKEHTEVPEIKPIAKNGNIGKSVNALINDLFVDENESRNVQNQFDNSQYTYDTTNNILSNDSYLEANPNDYVIVYEDNTTGPPINNYLVDNTDIDNINPMNYNIGEEPPVYIVHSNENEVTNNCIGTSYEMPLNTDRNIIDNGFLNDNNLLDSAQNALADSMLVSNELGNPETSYPQIDNAITKDLSKEIFNDDFNPATFDDLSSHSINFDNFKINYDTIDSIEINDAFNLGSNMDSKMNFDKLVTPTKKEILEDLTPKDWIYDENCIDNIFSMQQTDYSTIFESDIDLENSTNLAANLNQLIEENKVQYVPTDDDDLFIINLNSSIDADRLTDMLNIDPDLTLPDELAKVADNIGVDVNEPLIAQVEESIEQQPAPAVEVVKEVVKDCKMPKDFTCQFCSKTFKKKENFLSHVANHDSRLKKFKCHVCKMAFAYYSTMSKHIKRMHTPHVNACHKCKKCDRSYVAAWMLKQHDEREHLKLRPYKCDTPECTYTFYKKSDLVLHQRRERGERPYKCAKCTKVFMHVSHLIRHREKYCRLPITCKECNAVFRLPSQLEKHIQSKSCLNRKQNDVNNVLDKENVCQKTVVLEPIFMIDTSDSTQLTKEQHIELFCKDITEELMTSQI